MRSSQKWRGLILGFRRTAIKNVSEEQKCTESLLFVHIFI